jgi:hypothetical protein
VLLRWLAPMPRASEGRVDIVPDVLAKP